MSQTSKAMQDVIDERQRQVSAEGWTAEHDDEHTDGELAALVERIKARTATTEGTVKSLYLVQDDKGQPFTYWRFAKLFQAARDAAGEKWQFRDIRAKTGTEKTDEAGIRAAQKLLGHASVTTTEIYTRNRRGDRVKPLK